MAATLTPAERRNGVLASLADKILAEADEAEAAIAERAKGEADEAERMAKERARLVGVDAARMDALNRAEEAHALFVVAAKEFLAESEKAAALCLTLGKAANGLSGAGLHRRLSHRIANGLKLLTGHPSRFGGIEYQTGAFPERNNWIEREKHETGRHIAALSEGAKS